MDPSTCLFGNREARIAGAARTRTTTISASSSSRRKARVRLSTLFSATASELASQADLALFFPLALLEYAQVVKMLGNGRLEAMCFDGEKRLAHIRGKMRKKVRVASRHHKFDRS